MKKLRASVNQNGPMMMFRTQVFLKIVVVVVVVVVAAAVVVVVVVVVVLFNQNVKRQELLPGLNGQRHQ